MKVHCQKAEILCSLGNGGLGDEVVISTMLQRNCKALCHEGLKKKCYKTRTVETPSISVKYSLKTLQHINVATDF